MTITSDGQSAAETIKFGTINLTVDNDFVGETISCVNGGITITKTASSTSVTFRPPTTGTWTISGTVNGTTYTTTATISDLDTPVSATLNVHVIPDGSSVTPTDDVQTWLNCADVWDKNYTTVAEILADSTTLLTLMSDNNAADYLVRSTTWASTICADSTAMTDIGANNYTANTLLADATWCSAICNSTYFENVLNVKVPTMTSNTAPSGQCFGDSVYDPVEQRDYYKAFDGNSADAWGGQNQDGSYIGYKFPEQKKIYLFDGTDGNGRITTAKYQGSNNGTTWTDISSALSKVDSKFTYIKTNPSSYQWFRLYVVSASATRVSVSVLQFYGRADV